MGKWAVLLDGQDCWTVDGGTPMRFATEQEAEDELRQYLDDCADACDAGYMDDDGSDCDFRIVKIEE